MIHSIPYTLCFLILMSVTDATHLPKEHVRNYQNQRIRWGPCPTKINSTSTATIQCGSFTVPLDYSETTNETVDLELLRIPASKSPCKGSIFFNFGGPGDSGKESMPAVGKLLLGLTGGHNDLITIVPRGTGNTMPFSCYATEEERQVASLQFPSLAYNSSNTALGRAWGAGKILSETCLAAQNKTGRFLGTAFVARDMMRVVDALGEDGMLRYWGISYGSLLGATAISMFPDRVDKVILDGVVNAHEYYHGFESEQISSNDDILKGFCSGCVSMPENCPLARNHTAGELEQIIYNALEALKFNPVAVYSPSGSLWIDYTLVQTIILEAWYTPQKWPELSILLDSFLTGNLSQVMSSMTPSTAAVSTSPEAVFGIRCGDKIARRSSLSDMLPDIQERQQYSKLMGDSPITQPVNCAQWKLDAKERYTGDFRVKTRNPVLLIGNSFDPVTPLASAHNMSSGFEDSVVLQHNGYGHCTYLTQASLCTARAIRAYFANGTLPQPGIICDLDVAVFSGKTGWKEVVDLLD